MSSYSFRNVVASISGFGGVIALGNGSGVAEEGISVVPVGDKNTMTLGADGSGMHSMVVDDASTVTVRLLKTSPVNFLLQAMMAQQSVSGVGWGENTITVSDVQRGDVITCFQCAFKKAPDLNFAKEGGIVEWAFDAVKTIRVLGVGTPEL